jgi:pimeloyl-ACP methyl ester carboxylesterase
MILANAFAWPPDNYDMYFVNEWLESINVDSNSLILSFSRSELVWNKKKKKFLNIGKKSHSIKVNNPGVKVRHDLYVAGEGLALNVVKTVVGKRLIYSHGDYSPSLSVKRLDIASKHGDIPSFLYTKKGISIKRAVVYLHGGSFESCLDDAIFFKPELHFLLSQGTAIYAINTTGDLDCTSKYERYPDSIDRSINDWATTEIEDIFKAYSIIANRYPEIPVFLLGFSHGSYLTNLIASKYAKKSQFDAYVSMFGAWDNSIDDKYSHAATVGRLAVSDRHFHQKRCKNCKQGFVSSFTYAPSVSSIHGKRVKTIKYKLSTESAIAYLKRIRAEGDDIDMLYYHPLDSFYERTNPSRFISKIDRPLLSVHGDQDFNVSSINSDILKKGLSPRQKDFVTVIRYADEGHGIFTRKNFNSFTEKLLRFIEKFD